VVGTTGKLRAAKREGAMKEDRGLPTGRNGGGGVLGTKTLVWRRMGEATKCKREAVPRKRNEIGSGGEALEELMVSLPTKDYGRGCGGGSSRNRITRGSGELGRVGRKNGGRIIGAQGEGGFERG